DLKVAPDRVIMIGDDIDSDVGGAQQAGMRGVLVKTGKYRPELVARSGIDPDGVLDSIADIETLFR
ncbi:MAG: HAD hydrolase-like protein, partial [Leptospiraceae bacterium]|nr:HAD hydrolase-like protein [Leptospiraceae bacterium]